MKKPNYVCAMKKEELVFCSALESGNYPELYSEKVKSILGTIKDDELRKRVRSTLGKFKERNGELAQSNPYRLVVLNEILPSGIIPVTRPKLEIAKNNKPDFMNDCYVDFGLNLVGKKDYQVNCMEAEALSKELNYIGVDLTNPKLIPYGILTYDIDKESSNGLVFKLSEQGKDNKNSILNLQDYKWDYFPEKFGLFRAFLGGNGDWGAGDDDLANSNDDGRVVVETTGEASAQNFLKKYLFNLTSDRDKEIEKIEERYKRARDILTGNN